MVSALAKRDDHPMLSATITEARELDRRSSDGVGVTLFWSPRTNRLWVVVEDSRDGHSFEIDADPAHALDVFHHPYAYAPSDIDSLIAA
jgi:hypothetical protein